MLPVNPTLPLPLTVFVSLRVVSSHSPTGHAAQATGASEGVRPTGSDGSRASRTCSLQTPQVDGVTWRHRWRHRLKGPPDMSTVLSDWVEFH